MSDENSDVEPEVDYPDPTTMATTPEPATPDESAPQGPETSADRPSDEEVLAAVKMLYSGAPTDSKDLAAAGAVLYSYARADS